MGRNTKVIELFGVPACGKTTLKKYLCNAETCLTFGENKSKIPFFRIITCVPLNLIFFAILVKLQSKKYGHLFDVYTYRWIRFIVRLTYTVKYSQKDYIVVDHGFVQSIVSFEHGINLLDDVAFEKKVKKLISLVLKNFSIQFVHCDVDVAVAVQRIVARNRPSGRLDVITDKTRLVKEYIFEKQQYESLEKIICEMKGGCMVLNMDGHVNAVAKNLCLKLGMEFL